MNYRYGILAMLALIKIRFHHVIPMFQKGGKTNTFQNLKQNVISFTYESTSFWVPPIFLHPHTWPWEARPVGSLASSYSGYVYPEGSNQDVVVHYGRRKGRQGASGIDLNRINIT